MQDILFKTDEYTFSYRVAGVCVKNGKVFLQKPINDTAYAFPGGHVAFGETHEQTLIREFHEEIGADIRVGDLMWVGELFFPWGARQCHQICLYYAVDIIDDRTPLEGSYVGIEHPSYRHSDIEFHWVPVDDLSRIEVYPTGTAALLTKTGVQHFLYRETEKGNEEHIL